MLALVLRIVLAVVLVGAALLKLSAPRATQAALATFGLHRPRAQRFLWLALATSEIVLGGAVAAGSDAGAYLAAALQLAFAGALGFALWRGRAGAPCGCFGPRSRVGPAAVGRNLALASALVAVPALPASEPGTEEWLGAGLVVALLAIAALVVAVLALAREVGELRLAIAPQSALELDHEGPEIGSRTSFVERFGPKGGARLALAVFSSEGCPVCASLEPVVSLIARDAVVDVRTFDERRDAAAWRALEVPGAPYAVALGLDGTVLAKGTFNSLPQLEGLLGTAERRAAELARA